MIDGEDFRKTRGWFIKLFLVIIGIGIQALVLEGASMKESYGSELIVQYGWKEIPPPESRDSSQSPDGLKVAFWSKSGKITERALYRLILANKDGASPQLLLENVVLGEWVAFSPDGKKLAFAAVLSLKPSEWDNVEEWPSRSLSMYVMNLDTKRVQQLVKGNISPLVLSDQRWSPDSTAILYETLDHDIRIYHLSDTTSRSLVWGEHATWSPRGDLVAFRGLDRNYYVIKPDGTSKKLLLRNSFLHEIHGPLLWSPTAQYLLLTRWRLSFAEMSDYYVFDMATRRLTKINSNQ